MHQNSNHTISCFDARIVNRGADGENGTPPGGSTQTQAWDINNSGQIVGEYLDGSGDSHGFLLNGGVFTTIDFPAAQGGLGGDFAEGINDAGQVAIARLPDATGTTLTERPTRHSRLAQATLRHS